MTARVLRAMLLLAGLVAAGPAFGQITVLDQAQDAAPASDDVAPPPPPPPCGTQPLSIARMSWPSAELLAEMHNKEPATLDALRRALAEERVGLIGGEEREERLPLLSPETILEALQRGLARYETLAGKTRVLLACIFSQPCRVRGASRA